jgi:hypothetical protein
MIVRTPRPTIRYKKTSKDVAIMYDVLFATNKAATATRRIAKNAPFCGINQLNMIFGIISQARLF